jgi:hypothetical protein
VLIGWYTFWLAGYADQWHSPPIYKNEVAYAIYVCVLHCNYIFTRKLDKEKNQCIRGKTGAQNFVKEIKQ